MEAIICTQRKTKERDQAYSRSISEKCVECSVCFRADVCPTDAIHEQKLEWPRILRKAFSDPIYVHEGTDVPGRGTEEMKTNDVTGRYLDGFVGVGMEFGRPGTGTYLRETEKAIKRLVKMGIELEPLNPLTQLIENKETGELKKDVLDQRVLSAIVEFTVPIERAQEVFSTVKEIAREINTVFSLDLICKVAPGGEIPIIEEIQKAGLVRSLNGKTNVGLGRPLIKA
jgi:MinD superfamily P-loop ATPase